MAVRLLRALRLIWVLFASYAVQVALERALPGRAFLARRRARLHERNAARLLAGMLRLRGVFLKLGQVLSVMVGLLPEVYRRRLATLQDQVPPHPYAEIERAFVRSLGKRPGECGLTLDPEPIAAASLGQVHGGRLADGTEVAVKLLYPNIRAVIATDMRALRVAMQLFRSIVPLRDLEAVHRAVVDLLARETDYLQEAAGMKRVAQHFAARSDVLVPRVIDALTTRDVLTMTRMPGVKVSDEAALRAHGIDPNAVGKLLLSCFLEQLLIHRYFQSDPHPGNFLVHAPAPGAPLQLAILDHGAMCEVPPALVDGMIEALLAFFARDGQRLLRALAQMGFAAEDGDRELRERTVLLYFERLLSLKSHSPRALIDRRRGQLREMLDPQLELKELRALAHSFQLPEGWFYIERALVMMFGLIGAVAPELDLVQVAYPHLMPLLAQKSAAAQNARSASAE